VIGGCLDLKHTGKKKSLRILEELLMKAGHTEIINIKIHFSIMNREDNIEVIIKG
jgi:hypothetical protein